MDWRLARESGFLLRLAIPLLLTTFAQLAITTTDLIYLGALGADDLAAAAMAVALYQVVAMLGNTRVPTPLVIQSTPRLQSEIDTAPTIPEQSRPQGDTSGPEMGKIPEPEPHSEARK